MARCPAGHDSATADYCDECGAPIDGPHRSRRTEPVTPPVVMRAPCPVCAATPSGDDQFCEGCGHDLRSTGSPTGPWRAEIALDRRYFDRVAPTDLAFPPSRPVRVVRLDPGDVPIGRHREGAGAPVPAIDLSGDLHDPGVSRHHATLRVGPDGTPEVIDAGSSNGTTVNDDPTPLVPGAAMRLTDGDRVHLGAWTTITVRHPPIAGPETYPL